MCKIAGLDFSLVRIIAAQASAHVMLMNSIATLMSDVAVNLQSIERERATAQGLIAMLSDNVRAEVRRVDRLGRGSEL